MGGAFSFMDSFLELRIPGRSAPTSQLLTELACFGRFTDLRLHKARLLLHHGWALFGNTGPLPVTVMGVPVDYVTGTHSTFEFIRVQ